MVEIYEINGEKIEWEVKETEAQDFFADPQKFPSYIQKKYLGISEEEFSFTDSEIGDIPEGHEERIKKEKNPFTGELKELRYFYDFREDLEKRKKQAIDTIYYTAENIRNSIVGTSTSIERDGWTLKANISMKILNDIATEEEKKLIQIESDIRGFNETLKELAQKQVDKANKFALATVTIDGMTRNAIAQIEGCSTIEQVVEMGILLKEKADSLLDNL